MTQTVAASSSSSEAPLSAQWHAGHAVTTPQHYCTAYRHRYVVYAATPNAVAVVDVSSRPAAAADLPAEVRWRQQMRICALSDAAQEIAFVCGHPERDVVCVGTTQHGLYVTSLSHPLFSEASKLPRNVTGDATFSATFLFTEEANYLAFSSLLGSRPSDPTPYRLSLWCMDTQTLLWRGAMAPLTSMCSVAFDLSFAACQAGRVCLFTVQSNTAANINNHHDNSNNTEGGAAGPSPISSKPHSERNRLMVLSRLCSAVEELQDAHYTCCVASPAQGEDTYLALTSGGFLVAFQATSGSVTRWMDCKVPAATALCIFAEGSLVLTGELSRLFQVGTWEFQGKIKLDLPSGVVDAVPLPDVFTGAVPADSTTLLLFYRSGRLSFHSVEPKAGTHRLSLHRTSFFSGLLLHNGGAGVEAAQWLVLSSSLWCWWTPQSLTFVSAVSGGLVAAFAVSSSCVTLHPASGTVIVYDTQRHALVAYGRTPVAEVGVLCCATGARPGSETQEEITSLASSATGESLYALVSLPKSALPPRLRRYRCGWSTVKTGEVSEKGFYLDCMKSPDSVGNGSAAVVAAASAATSVSLPAGTHTLLVHAAAEGDRVVAVQRSSVVSVGLSGHRERAAAPTYTHFELIQRVLPCRGGLLVLGAASCAYVQWKGATSFRWAARPLPGLVFVGGAGRTKKAESKKKEPSSAPDTRCGAVAVLAAVATRRSDVAAVCVGRALTVWQLSDSPRLLASASIGTTATLMVADVVESTRRVYVSAVGAAGIDAYELGPVELSLPAANTEALALSPDTPVKQDEPPSRTETKASRPGLSPPTPRTAASATTATAILNGVSPLPLPSKTTPPPPAAAQAGSKNTKLPASATTRAFARTPRSLTNNIATTSLAEARRQRRTASARVPSSRQLSERFDELTGFYAKQKQEHQGNEHPRTPRLGGTTTRQSPPQPQRQRSTDKPLAPSAARSPHTPTAGKKSDDSIEFSPSSTPRDNGAKKAANTEKIYVDGCGDDGSPVLSAPTQPLPPTAASAVSAIDVSALTVDSQVLRSAVTAATAAVAASDSIGNDNCPHAQREDGENDGMGGVCGAIPAPTSAHASSLPWSDSPPQRGDPRRDPAAAVGGGAYTPACADDVVLRSSASAAAPSSTEPPSQPVPHQTSPPQVQLRHTEASQQQQQEEEQPRLSTAVRDSNSFASEEFTVQARQLRASLLHIKELLEQSETTESSVDGSLALTTEADLDELATLLTTVAAQLHQRQGRRSAESA